MFQHYFIKQSVLALIAAGVLLGWSVKSAPLREIGQAVWLTFAFINLLFALLYIIANESLKAKSHKDFTAIFGVLFAVKVGAALSWLLTTVFLFQIRSNSFLLTFFALYLSYTFLLALHIVKQSGRKNA